MINSARLWSLAVVLLSLWIFSAPTAWAQDEEGWGAEEEEDKAAGDKEKKDKKDKKDKPKNEPAKDEMWDAPETDTGEAASGEPELVIPSGYPVAEVDRPLALPPMTLEPEISIRFDFLDDIDNRFGLRTGARFGIIDNLEAGMFFPLGFAPKFRAGDLELYGLYDLTSLIGADGFNLAGRLVMMAPLSNGYTDHPGGDFAMRAEALAKFKFTDMLAATALAGFGFVIGDLGPVNMNYFIVKMEGGLIFQAIEPLALHLRFGLTAYMGDVDEVLLPLLMRVQYTLIHDLDLFLDTGLMDLTDVADPWIVGVIFGASYRIGF